MPRPVTQPALPRTPGGWLACYRYRTPVDGGGPLSPEKLGQQLGVSGDTVRRWENDRAVPTALDVQRISEICHLSPMETDFLNEAMSASPIELAPEAHRFSQVAERLLAGEFPAYIFDSLFYVRAWNQYVDILQFPHYPPMGEHIIESILLAQGPSQPGGLDPAERQSRWLRDFWFRTAHLCGTESYKAVIERLTVNPEFCKRWMKLALEPGYERDRLVFTPFFFEFPALGRFRASTSVVSVPPVYYYREFVPIDDLARERWEQARQECRPRVSVLDNVHWALSSGARDPACIPAVHSKTNRIDRS